MDKMVERLARTYVDQGYLPAEALTLAVIDAEEQRAEARAELARELSEGSEW